MKRRIRLTESDIQNIVKRSVKRILKENMEHSTLKGRWDELCWRVDDQDFKQSVYDFLYERGLLEEFIDLVSSDNNIDGYHFEDDANDPNEYTDEW